MKSKDYIHLAGMTLLIFMGTYAILALAGFVPEQFKFGGNRPPVTVTDGPEQPVDDEPATPQDANLVPQKIEIAKIGVSSVIQAPRSADVSVLDAALARGATYYPGSGTLQGGNMFIFGHSTNWKVVNNPAYKTFNNLEDLVAGDEIVLTSGGKKYIYAVQSVIQASENDVLVEFDKGGRTLTISTCDTFGQKQDRWVVEAELKEVV